MRHIPEDELHAYLDQALSRSQCIEIETHLARCAGCRRERDATAALRDRTTALLARAMPRTPTPPNYQVLATRAATTRRHGWRRTALWAASLAGALVGGWGLRAVMDPHPGLAGATEQVVAAPDPAGPGTDLASAPEPLVLERVTQPPPAPMLMGSPVRLGTGAPSPAARSTAAVEPDPPATPVDALWSAVSLPEAEEATGNLVPLVPGLPVTEIRVRPGGPQERPLIMVAQQLASGELVHTLEGPVAAVAAEVADRLDAGDLRSSEPARSLPDYIDSAEGIRRTSRVLVLLSRLPPDSLNALVQSVILK